MEHWRKVVPGKILDVTYENLVTQPIPHCVRAQHLSLTLLVQSN